MTSAERPKPGAGDRRFLGREDVKRLLDAPPERYRVAIACGFFSGLRLSALLGLTWADIDLRDATIHVRMQTGRNGRSTIARS